MSPVRDFLTLSGSAGEVENDLQLSLGQVNVGGRRSSSTTNDSSSFLFPNLPIFSCNNPNPTLKDQCPYSTARDHIFQEQGSRGPFWRNTGRRRRRRRALPVHRGVVQPLLLHPQRDYVVPDIVNPSQGSHRYCPYHNPNPNALSNSTLRRNGRGMGHATLYPSSGSTGGNMEHLSALIRGRSRYMHEIGMMPIEQEEVDSTSRIPAPQLPSVNGGQWSADVDGMPCVSTAGANGRGARGILYKFNSRREFRIMCVCHGRSFSPGEFVRHAGTIESSNPLRQIMIVPY